MPENRPSVSSRTPLVEAIERVIRARGVRVAERLALLRKLTEDGGPDRIRAQVEEEVAAVRRAAAKVKGALG